LFPERARAAFFGSFGLDFLCVALGSPAVQRLPAAPIAVNKSQEPAVSDDPIDLDSRRDAAGVMGAEMRRSVSDPWLEDRTLAADRLAEVERRLAAPPAAEWAEAAERAIYVLRGCASAARGGDARLSALIASAIADLERLAAADLALAANPEPSR
jgi:hypothetical protein